MEKKVQEGKIIIIVAPSGTGKSTLIKRLKKDFPILVESISYTTRPNRPGEAHGVNYFFISKDEFLHMRERGEFLEWAQVHDNFYGTSKRFIEDNLRLGKILLLDVDVQGTDSFKKHFGAKARAIFINPPSIEELEKRLRARGTDSEQVMQTRLANARKELLRKDDYDFRVDNIELGKAYTDLKDVVNKILKD